LISKESFQNVHSWIKEVEKYSNESAAKIVIANKCDLDDEIEVTD
jgi:GTPase SAR1 family protein